MHEWKKLLAEDGHTLNAYVAYPTGEAVGAIVVVQEIFGVNSHIRNITDRFAAEGLLAIAPALFDRIEPGVELKYEGDDLKQAYNLMQKLTPHSALLDITAAFSWVMQQWKGVGLVGFCYGGLMSWLTATRGAELKMQPACCVAYYPGGIGKFANEEPGCPVMLHFGLEDSHIGQDQVDAVRSAHPEVQINVYKGAEHGFNCDARASYNAAAASVAWGRTVEFVKSHVA